MDDLNLMETAEETSNSGPFFCMDNLWPIVGVAAAGIATGAGIMYACTDRPADGVEPSSRVERDPGNPRQKKPKDGDAPIAGTDVPTGD
jgi:hypothetical protein